MVPSKVLRLGYVLTNYPQFTECGVADPMHCKKPGFLIEIYRSFAKTYGYTLELVRTSEYGGCDKRTLDVLHPVPNCTGLIHQIQMGETNGTIADLNIGYDNRIHIIDYSPYLPPLDLGYVMRSASDRQEGTLYFSVFDIPTIVLIFFLVLVISCFHVFYGIFLRQPSFSRTIVYETFWSFTAMTFWQDSNLSKTLSRSKYEGPHVIAFWIVLFFLYQIYNGVFRGTTLIQQEPKSPFQTRHELLILIRNKQLRLMMLSMEFAYALSSGYQREMDEAFRVNPPFITTNKTLIRQHLCRDRGAVYFGHVAEYETFFSDPNCPMLIIKDPAIQKRQLAFAFPKDSSLFENMTQYMLKLYSMEKIDALIRRNYLNVSNLQNFNPLLYSRTLNQEPVYCTLNSLKRPFYILIGGFVFSVIILGMETVFYRRRQKLVDRIQITHF